LQVALTQPHSVQSDAVQQQLDEETQQAGALQLAPTQPHIVQSDAVQYEALQPQEAEREQTTQDAVPRQRVGAPVVQLVGGGKVGGKDEEPYHATLRRLAARIGGEYTETFQFDPRCTHMVVVSLCIYVCICICICVCV